MEIQKAYEQLSMIKNKRAKRSKVRQTEENQEQVKQPPPT